VWSEVFTKWAPALDLIAPQDSMGAQGNSFANVSAYLGQISNASRMAGRVVWSNTELFEVYPPTCQWPATCRGRHPAHFSRIVKQLANEARFVDKLIAWEWSSCLSRLGGQYLYRGSYPNATGQLYAQYHEYVHGVGGK
jgi:hypothetical protein